MNSLPGFDCSNTTRLIKIDAMAMKQLKWQYLAAIFAKVCSLVQLKSKITRQLAAREQQQRRKNLTKYIPNAASAIFKVLQVSAPFVPAHYKTACHAVRLHLPRLS